MKKTIQLIIVFLLLTFNSEAQKRALGFKNNDKIKALKTAFITEALDLTSKEAEKFWPIYNAYDKKIRALRFKKTRGLRDKVKRTGGIDAFTEKEAEALLDDFLNIEKDIIIAKSNLSNKLKHVISSIKILKLYKAEDDFNRRLLQRLQNRRKPNQRFGNRN